MADDIGSFGFPLMLLEKCQKVPGILRGRIFCQSQRIQSVDKTPAGKKIRHRTTQLTSKAPAEDKKPSSIIPIVEVLDGIRDRRHELHFAHKDKLSLFIRR